MSNQKPGREPKRNFSTSGNEYTTSTFRDRLLLGLHFTLPFLLILLILGAGVCFAFVNLKRESTAVSGGAGSSAHGAAPLSKDAFMSRYLEARGGLANLNGFSSIQLIGKLRLDGLDYDFTLVKKLQGLALLTIAFENMDLTIGLSGKGDWKRVDVRGEGTETSWIGEEEAGEYSDMREFFDPLTRLAVMKSGKILSLEKERFEGQEYLRVALESDPAKVPVILYVDPEVMTVDVMRESLPDSKERLYRFSDYRPIRGLPVPFVTEVWVGDKMVNGVYLEKARPNVCVMSSIFDAPEDLGEMP